MYFINDNEDSEGFEISNLYFIIKQNKNLFNIELNIL
jgi:hypothetical protein